MAVQKLFDQAFVEGRLAVAEAMAVGAIHAGRPGADPAAQGRAHWNLARVRAVQCNYLAVFDEARRSLQFFERCDDPAGQARSLMALCLASVRLGRHEFALSAALQADALNPRNPSVVDRIHATTYLGLALAHAGRLANAHAVFDRAMAVAQTTDWPDAERHPMLMRLVSCAMHEIHSHVLTGRDPDPAQLASWLRAARQPADGGFPYFTLMGTTVAVEAVIATLSAFEACWEGDITRARARVAYSLDMARAQPVALNWFMPYALLGCQQVAYFGQDYQQAITAAQEAATLAERLQDWPLAWTAMGLRLRSQAALGQISDTASRWMALTDAGRHRAASAQDGAEAVTDLATQPTHADGLDAIVDAWGRRHALSEAEHAVLALLARGLGSLEIAATRSTAEGTTRQQIKAILSKSGCKSRVELMAALMQGFSAKLS